MAKQPNAPQSRQDKIAAATPKQKKTTPIIAGLIVLVVLAGIAWAVMSGMGGSQDEGPEYAVPPTAAGPTGGIVLNQGEVAEGVPTLDIYEDPQCPACAVVHGMLGPTASELAESGRAKVVVHVKTFMDSNLRNDSSKRSANGMMCAADAGKFAEYHDTVFSNQSQEGQGWTDEQLQQFAQTAGITGDDLTAWQACQSEKTYDKYLDAVEDSSARDGVTGTPLYRVNGEDFQIQQQTTGADLEKAIVDAGGTPAAPTTETPAPTASN